MRGHHLITELKRFAVTYDFVWFHRWKKQCVAESEVTVSALAQQPGIAFTRNKFRASCFLELRQTAGVIIVRVTIKQIFYVAQFETELHDVALDLWGGFHKSAIQEKMALRRGD